MTDVLPNLVKYSSVNLSRKKVSRFDYFINDVSYVAKVFLCQGMIISRRKTMRSSFVGNPAEVGALFTTVLI